MIVDGRTVAQGSVLDCDVCVVGAGPAGMIAASEFLGHDCSVCVVESGAVERDDATQALGRAEVEENDDLYPDPLYAHDRRIGGTSVQWDVMIASNVHAHLMPLDPGDFRKRDWFPGSGWPIDHHTLAPYVARAQEATGAGPFDYDPATWADSQHKPFDIPQFSTRMLSFGRQDHFRQVLPQRLAKASNVRLLTWSTVVELETMPDAGSVSSLQVACLDGNRFQVRARMVILAQGAFEVPRLLLASRAAMANGLGNQHDLVGRYLMDRQIIKTGTLFPASAGGLRDFGFYDMRQVRGRHVLGKLTLSERVLESEVILGNLISFSPRRRFSLHEMGQRPFGRATTSRSPAQRSLRDLRAAWKQRRLPKDALRLAWNLAAGVDDLIYLRIVRRMPYRPEFNFDSLGWSSSADLKRFASLEVHQMCEQSPDPDNRITLSEGRDATGMPESRVSFRWNEWDIHSILRTQAILQQALAGSGTGRLRLERRGALPVLAQMSAHHPSGTTRMPQTPSVVSSTRTAGCTAWAISSSRAVRSFRQAVMLRQPSRSLPWPSASPTGSSSCWIDPGRQFRMKSPTPVRAPSRRLPTVIGRAPREASVSPGRPPEPRHAPEDRRPFDH